MVEPQQVKHRGIEVVDRYGILDHVVGIIVGRAKGCSRANASAGQPDRETPSMMITPVVSPLGSPLAVDRPSEFASPDHQGVIQKSPLSQICQQGRTGLVDIAGLQANVAR